MALSISLSVDKEVARVGDKLTFTIKATEDGSPPSMSLGITLYLGVDGLSRPIWQGYLDASGTAVVEWVVPKEYCTTIFGKEYCVPIPGKKLTFIASWTGPFISNPVAVYVLPSTEQPTPPPQPTPPTPPPPQPTPPPEVPAPPTPQPTPPSGAPTAAQPTAVSSSLLLLVGGLAAVALATYMYYKRKG